MNFTFSMLLSCLNEDLPQQLAPRGIESAGSHGFQIFCILNTLMS